MRLPLLTLVAVAVLALAACTGSAGDATPVAPGLPAPAAPAAADLDGRTFLGTEFTGSAIADVSKIRLSFQDGTLSGTGGCNLMGGSYQIVDGALATGSMATTEMACEEPLMAQDAWLAAFLPGAAVTLDGNTLTLSKDGTRLVMTDKEVAEPDLPLAQRTNWVLEGIAQGGEDGSSTSMPAGVTAGISFGGDQANVAFGCNSGGGEVVITDATLTFGPMISTKMACEGPGNDVERVMQSVLSGEVPYTIDGDTLTITGADGTTLTFRGRPG